MSLCFFDFETCSALDLTIVGGAKYSRDPSTFPLVLSWAIDDGPVKLWVPELGDALPKATWDFIVGMVDYTGAFPKELHDFAKGEGNYWVAWNAAFDRNIIQNCAHPRFGFPAVATTSVLDAMAQASASNLPGRLDMAGRMLGLGGKTEGGKTIMKMFADASAEMPTKIDHWKTYLTYAAKDTDLMRDIWRTTRPLDASEWVEYWVSEKINDRGMLADLDVCRGALKYRAEEEEYNRTEIKRLTENMVPAVTMTRRINEWVFPRLPHDLQELMVKERNEDGEPTKLTLSKDVIGRMLEEINMSDTPPEDDVVEVLELLQFGRASSAVKFEKILNQADDGRLKGSYVFNGAGQTGRMSSRGVQVHNLPRKSMSTKQQPTLELDLLDMVAAQVPIEVIRSYGPVSSTLSKLIRPTFIAPPKRRLVWGDWAAIEARVAPWLADSRSAQTAVLDIFETCDIDPKKPDLYIFNAEAIFGTPADVIWERYKNGDKEANEMRQSGKVACIAKGQLVLTDTGLVPIENVTIDMRVWDGQSFVSHQGSVFKGYKDVWEYQGLIATADHVVWTTQGTCKFGDAAASGLDLVQSGSGRDQIWVGNNSDRRAEVCVPRLQRRVLREREVQWLRQGKLGLSGQPPARSIEGVSSLLATAPYSEMVGSTIDGREVALSEPEAPCVRELWRARDRVPVHVCIGSRAMGSGEPWTSPRSGNRQDRREQSLRAGEHPVGYRASTAGQQALVEDRGELGVQAGGMAVRVQYGASQTVGGAQPRGDYSAGARRSGGNAQGLARYRGKVAVYDIINAGPNHRFTVSGKLVHNCLALVFLGGVGALRAMARGYGMKLSNEAAQKIVDGWRDRNRWARKFGDQCEDAAFAAISHAEEEQKAGRLSYVYIPQMMRGTLLCRLPDGRFIAYPMARVEDVEKFGRMNRTITYLNGMGRRSLWSGLQVENVTQATAASMLRQTLVHLEQNETEAQIIGHTHDEVICEIDEDQTEAFADRLKRVMVAGFDWTKGLPLGAEVKSDWYYHK
jgi:DNA polymerase